ncbi:hypothetical protein TIFTF001_036278 [Ficus carica]|uniref:Transmembrane protein n=1 Tax=Ficus carica TaxID=3494 RepID=A0AA88JAY4_FICCA|nr:hypothetical protein TIFTF001_036278 [Ficus carica]
MASLSLSGSSVRSQAIPRFPRPKLTTTLTLSPTSLGFRFSSLTYRRKSNLHEQDNMIGLTAHLQPMTCLPSSSTPRPLSNPSKKIHLRFRFRYLKFCAPIRRRPTRFLTLASNDDNKNNNNSNNNNNNELRKDPNGMEENGKKSGGLGPEESDASEKENGRSIFNSIRWGELFLNPDPDNILAVGLTGLLTWASVQVLLQLLFISVAILVAAVKYSLIAALLIFILITLL